MTERQPSLPEELREEAYAEALERYQGDLERGANDLQKYLAEAVRSYNTKLADLGDKMKELEDVVSFVEDEGVDVLDLRVWIRDNKPRVMQIVVTSEVHQASRLIEQGHEINQPELEAVFKAAEAAGVDGTILKRRREYIALLLQEAQERRERKARFRKGIAEVWSGIKKVIGRNPTEREVSAENPA